ncbi:hypothetical protein BDZ45DRAFT_676442 [Acephala macrosclerotiorum]|nr:hypothetical protein BDZ45DRAFT_676442 [Acephala macrosclerotiorum]
MADYTPLVVPDLSNILQERGIEVSGNKSDHIERLQEDDRKAQNDESAFIRALIEGLMGPPPPTWKSQTSVSLGPSSPFVISQPPYVLEQPSNSADGMSNMDASRLGGSPPALDPQISDPGLAFPVVDSPPRAPKPESSSSSSNDNDIRSNRYRKQRRL